MEITHGLFTWSNNAHHFSDKARATASASTPEEKLQALYRFVASEVHYARLAVGLGGHEPRSANRVLETGWGDCRNKRTLLAARADQFGVTLDPVLVGAGMTLQTDTPVACPVQSARLGRLRSGRPSRPASRPNA